MNNWSFMRCIDENKIAKLEQATIEYVVKNGYGGASVSEIAKHAGVSKGYLYRFYKNKQELVQSLLTNHIAIIFERIEELLNQDISTNQVLEYIIHYAFEIGEKKPNHIKFIYVLLHDYNFQLEEEQRYKIKMLIQRFYKIGVEQQLVNTQATEEEIFTIAVIYPIDFINLRYKNFFKNSSWNKKDIDRVTEFCINALKN